MGISRCVVLAGLGLVAQGSIVGINASGLGLVGHNGIAGITFGGVGFTASGHWYVK